MKLHVGIQYLRGVAAILVVICHTMTMSGVANLFPFSFGEFGVDIFFVISGFIMWVATNKRDTTPVKFWLARATRIVPLYWLFTTLVLVSIVLTPSAFFHERSIDWLFVLKSYLFIPSSHPDVGGTIPLYAVGWTLNYEAFFYLIFGLALLVPKRSARLALVVGAFATLVLVGLNTALEGAASVFYTSSITLEFVFGVLIGAAATQLAKLPNAVGFACLLLACVLFPIGVMQADLVPRATWYGPGAALLIASAVILEKLITVRVSSTLLFLGNASFSMYLAHPFAQRIWYSGLSRVMGGITTAPAITIYFVGSVLVGIAGGVAVYLLIEKPLLSIRRKKRISTVVA